MHIHIRGLTKANDMKQSELQKNIQFKYSFRIITNLDLKIMQLAGWCEIGGWLQHIVIYT